ncbi:hypothetical protein WMY93_008474 [Mugilogobius chulae]|uniref:phosphoinositide 5-phosphatase n=1 Tax=Mugilogobius chulae TaxID=88201 RepID=A0AAW0PG13_9GOBI
MLQPESPVITNEYMKDNFLIKIETWHKPDMGHQENVHGLDPETWKKVDVVYIDIADRSQVEPKDYKPDEDPCRFKSVKTSRGPLGPDWKKELPNKKDCPHMCAYKLVTVKFKWWGLQNKVENFIQKQEKRLFTNFHRQLFCWIDHWIELTMEDIRRMEEDTRKELDEMRVKDPVKGMTSTPRHQRIHILLFRQRAVVRSKPSSPGIIGREQVEQDLWAQHNTLRLNNGTHRRKTPPHGVCSFFRTPQQRHTPTGEIMSTRRSVGVNKCRLHMVTWNVGTAEPPEDVSSLLQLNGQTQNDIYIIGLQEVNATPIRFISDMIAEDSWSHVFMDTLGPRGFVKVTSVRMQGLLLLVFAKQVHLPFIRNIQSTYTRTGIFGYWGNKGAVSIRFSFYGQMLCFLNCHLAAHMNYALQRVDEFEYILDNQDFDISDTPHVLDHKVVFWFGDLNFRIADHGLHFLRSSIEGGRLNLLWSKDQLTMMKKKEPFLQEFEEGPLNFQPTYKFKRNSDTYDISCEKTWFGFK